MIPEEFNPYRAPEAILTLPAGSQEPEALRPVPFEDIEAEPRFWPRVWAMFSALFKGPLELADRVPVTRGFSAPWRFQLVLTVPLFLLIVAIAAIFGVVMFAVSMESQAHRTDAPPAWIFGLIPLIYLVILPLMQFINMIVIGAFSHGCLWIWGGLRRSEGLHASCRLTGYFLGFFMLVGFVPIIGSLAALIGPTFLGMAMARMHHTDTWRGICAAYTPLVILCCALAVLFIALLAFAR